MLSFIPNDSKTYTLTGTNANGCSSTSIVDVNVNALPMVVATASKTAICFGENVILMGSGADTYVWDNNVTDGVEFTPSTLKTYTVIGTDDSNGCSSTSTISVNVNTLPTIKATASKTAICLGDNVILTGSGASTYVWDNNLTDGIAFAPSTLKTYTVTGTDVNGCSSTASLDVNVNALPKVVATASKTAICLGENVTLTGSGADTYIWDKNVTNGVEFAPSIMNTYTVTGTDINGCSKIASVIIKVNINPLPTIIAKTSKSSICLGENVTLTGSGGSTYSWDNNVTDGVSFAPSKMKTYTLTGTDANGCSSTASVDVIVNALPTVVASASKSAICLGENVTLTGSGASTYVWDNNVMDGVSFAPSKMKTYTLAGTDANGCVATSIVSVNVNALPTVVASASKSAICLGENVILTGSGASTYTWDNNVTDGVSFAPSTLKTYIVTGKDVNGCSSTATVEVKVDNCSGIEEKLISNFKLYPNPTVDKLILDATDVITYIGYSYKIIDMQGKEVYNAELRSAKTEISLKNVCSRGVYIFHLIDDHGVSVKQSKLVLEY